MNKTKVIKGIKYFLVKCPDCRMEHPVSHKNYYAQRSGWRNLSFRCRHCGQLRGARTRRNPDLKKMTNAGYVKLYMPEHPMADKRGEVYEHRFVMFKKLGRLLSKKDHIHHRDGNKANNQLDNLELWGQRKHLIFHVLPRVKKGHQGFIS